MKAPSDSLEIAKLLVSALTPLAVALLGVYITRLAKRFEHLQWRNQRLIEKRIVIYDQLAPQLNDLLCYFTFVGCWKEFSPREVVTMKREIDKKIYLAAPLFAPDFHTACTRFIGLCFATFQGWGVDAKLKTPPDRRMQAAGDAWQSEWQTYFADEFSHPSEIRAAYQEIMAVFSRELGLNLDAREHPLGMYPTNITRA